MSTVREVDPPPAVSALAGLEPVSYREAFEFTGGVERGPEQWARLILEDAPRRDRFAMLGTWVALGVGLAPLGSAGQVLGWRIRRHEPDAIVLGIRALVGLTARIVVRTDGPQVMHAMFIRYDRRLGARLWTRIAPGHHRFVAGLLERVAREAVKPVSADQITD
jgi:hypothetical protein